MIPGERSELRAGIRAQLHGEGANVNSITEWVAEFIDIKFISKCRVKVPNGNVKIEKPKTDEAYLQELAKDIKKQGGFKKWKRGLKAPLF